MNTQNIVIIIVLAIVFYYFYSKCQEGYDNLERFVDKHHHKNKHHEKHHEKHETKPVVHTQAPTPAPTPATPTPPIPATPTPVPVPANINPTWYYVNNAAMQAGFTNGEYASVENVPNALQCQQNCAEDSKCTYAVYGSNNKSCNKFIHNIEGAYARFVGVRRNDNTFNIYNFADITGIDIPPNTSESLSEQECQSSCTNNQNCSIYVWQGASPSNLCINKKVPSAENYITMFKP